MKAQSLSLPGSTSIATSAWRWYVAGGDILLFIGMSLAMAIFIGQERMISKGELTYWLLIGPALLMPMIRIRQTVENLLFGCARPLALFGVLSGAWFLLKHDIGAIPPIFLLVWVAAWACRKEARISTSAFFVLLLGFYVVASVSFLMQPSYENYPWLMEHLAQPEAANGDADVASEQPLMAGQTREGLNINAWGILPGQTAPAFAPWRISVTPNIATSGIVSMLALLIAFRRFRFRPLDGAATASAAYFAILSFVRAAVISLVLFSGTYAVLKALPRSPRLRVAAAFLMTIGISVVVAVSPFILFHLQDVGIVSRLFLRGQTDMSIADIYRQAYRPWLWGEHFKLFYNSPYLMGHGSELASSATKNIINAGQVRSDSVSFLTRLLATYGLPMLGVFIFLCERCYHHSRKNDVWAVAMLSVFVWLMMTWGSLFHPTNGIFVLAFLIMGKGSEAFSDRSNHHSSISTS